MSFEWERCHLDKLVLLQRGHDLSTDKRGKGNAVLRLFRLIDSDIYIMVDGDNTYDLNDLPQAVDKFIDGCYDMMVGDRFAEHSNSYMRPGHGFGNALFTRII